MDDETDYENIENFWLICKDCGNASNYPRLSEFNYGEFIGRSKNDEYVYVNSFEPVEDKFFKDFKKYKYFTLKSEEVQRKIIQTAFGNLVLDPDEFGDPYAIYGTAYCTSCGSKNVEREDVPKDDPYPIYPVSHATCRRWSALSQEEQQKQIEKAINDYRG